MASARQDEKRPLGLAGLCLAAWALLILVGMSPYAELLSHHVIGKRGLSPMTSLTLFMAGWLLMLLAMMVPGTLPTLARLREKRRSHSVFWLVGYMGVWLETGLLIYRADLTLHTLIAPHVPSVTRWLFPATLLVAGLYEFTPWKRRCLRACRTCRKTPSQSVATLIDGLKYGWNCVGGCWALMPVMTATGKTSLIAMLVLGTVFTLERTTPWEQALAYPVGALLLVSAVVIVVTGLYGLGTL